MADDAYGLIDLTETAGPRTNLEFAKLVFVALMIFDHIGYGFGAEVSAIATLVSRGCMVFFALSIGVHLSSGRSGTARRYLLKLLAVGAVSEVAFLGLLRDKFMLDAMFALAVGVLMALPMLRWPGRKGLILSVAVGALYLPAVWYFDGGLIAFSIPLIAMLRGSLYVRSIPALVLAALQLLHLDPRFGYLLAMTLVFFPAILLACSAVRIRRLPAALWYGIYPASLYIPLYFWGPWPGNG